MSASRHRKIITPAKCLLPLFLLCLSSACGFQLRGMGGGALHLDEVYLSASGAAEWAEVLRVELERAGIPLRHRAEQATWHVLLSREQFSRELASVSAATGKAEEYRLILSGVFSVRDQQGRVLVDGESVQAQREYTYAEEAALAKSSEETTIRADLRRQLCRAVLRRLEWLAARQQGG